MRECVTHHICDCLDAKMKRLENIVAETKHCMKMIVNNESQCSYRRTIMGNGIAHCTDIIAMIEALDRDNTGKEGEEV